MILLMVAGVIGSLKLLVLRGNGAFFWSTPRFWVSDLVPTSRQINTSLSLSQNCLAKPPLGTYMEVKGEQNEQSWQRPDLFLIVLQTVDLWKSVSVL